MNTVTPTTKAEKIANIARIVVKAFKVVLFAFKKDKSKAETIADAADQILNSGQ